MACLVVLTGCSRETGDVAAGPASATTSSTTTTTGLPSTPEELPVGASTVPEAPPAEEGEDDPVVRRPAAAATPRARVVRSASSSVNRIEIPAIGLSHATFEGIDLATINRGPSHWPDTPQPGERGNTVFPGHRTTYSRPFWDIDKLVAGDEVIFTTPRGRFTYRVTHTFVVGSHDTWIVGPTDHATFTIFACHPKGSARQRYVVKGDLVSPPAAAPPPPPSPRPSSPPPEAATTTTTTAPPGLVPGLGF